MGFITGVLVVASITAIAFTLTVLFAWRPWERRRLRKTEERSAIPEDPRDWLRRERKKEMAAWDAEFIRLCGGDSSLEARALHMQRFVRRSDIKAIQQKASNAGYYQGPIDGVPGVMLMRALKFMADSPQLLGQITFEARDFHGDILVQEYEDPLDPRRFI